MRKILLVLFIMFLLASVNQAEISLDHVDGEWTPGYLTTYDPVVFHIRYTNNYGMDFGGITNGFRVYSPNGATWAPIVIDTVSHGWPDMLDFVVRFFNYSITGSGADTVGFSAAKIYSNGLYNGFNEIALTISTRLDPSQIGKTICLDSSFYPTSGYWIWTPPSIQPVWDGPHCFIIDPGYLCGDLDDDGELQVQDVIYFVDYLFRDGLPPIDLRTADIDDIPGININDLVFYINYLFSGGPDLCMRLKDNAAIV